MGYSPGFLLKNGQISTLANSSEIDTNSRARSQKSFQEGLGGVSESLERFPGLAKIGHVQTMGYSPGFLLKNGQISTLANSPESTQTVAQGVRNHLWRVQEAFQRVWSDYQDLQKSAMFKPWAIAQAFCSKTAKFRPLRIHPKSTQTVAQGVRNNFRRVQVAFQRVWSDFQDLPKSAMFKTMGYSPGFLLKIGQISTLANSSEIDTNSCARSQKSFQEGLGGVSESLERFPGLAKIGHVQNHGLQPRLFAQKRPNFDPCEFIRNRHKQSRKELEIILRRVQEAFQRVWSDFQDLQKSAMFKPWAIAQAFCSKTAKFRPLRIHPKSTQTVVQGVRNHFKRVQQAFQRVWSDFQDLQKSAMFKPWAIAQAFCSKTAKFRPLRIHPKSTQTVVQGVRNLFKRVQEAFQRVWSDFQDLPKSAMFKTMGYSPGFLLKNGQISTLANSPESTQTVAQGVRNHLWRVQEAFQRVWSDYQDLQKSAMFKTMGYSPGFLLKNGQISTLANSPESTQTVAQGVRNHLRRVQEAFQRVWSDYQDLQKSAMFKPWAIAQAFCSKTAKFRPLRIHPKSTQTVAQGVRNHFRRVQVAFQRVWSDFQDLPKSAMFKTMGYSPGFLLKNGQISTLANSSEIDTNSRARSQKSF